MAGSIQVQGRASGALMASGQHGRSQVDDVASFSWFLDQECDREPRDCSAALS